MTNYPDSEHYNKEDFGKIICFDIDGVIFKRDVWRGPDHFGKPIDGAAKYIKKLHNDGWYIVLLTTRLVCPALIKHLLSHNIYFDDINGRRDEDGRIRFQHHGILNVDYTPSAPLHYWRHNPSEASIKPIASVYVDDMDWRQGGKNFDKRTWRKLYRRVTKRLNRSRFKLSTYISQKIRNRSKLVFFKQKAS